jgi:hypothetical protein
MASKRALSADIAAIQKVASSVRGQDDAERRQRLRQAAVQQLWGIEAQCAQLRAELERLDLPDPYLREICRFAENRWARFNELPNEEDGLAPAMLILMVAETVEYPLVTREEKDPYTKVPCTCEEDQCPNPDDQHSHFICACPRGRLCPRPGGHWRRTLDQPWELQWRIEQQYPNRPRRLTIEDCAAALFKFTTAPGRVAKGHVEKWQGLADFVAKAGFGRRKPETLRQSYLRLRKRLRSSIDASHRQWQRPAMVEPPVFTMRRKSRQAL